VLINVYALNKHKDLLEFLKNLLNTLKRENLESQEILLWEAISMALSIQPLTKKEARLMKENRSYHVLGIVYKMSISSFTWSQKSPRVFCRLDYWLISNNLSDLVTSTDIIPAIRTDHDAISLKLESWKMSLEVLAIGRRIVPC